MLLSGHHDAELLNDAESTQKVKIAIIVSLKREPMGKLKNRIPGLRLLISSLPGSALRTFFESRGKLRDVNKSSQNLAW